MRKRLFIVVCAVIVLVAGATPASAEPPLDVSFSVETAIPVGGGVTGGPFTASGPAVDVGVMCPSGDTIDVTASAVGMGQWIIYRIAKEFSCDDGSGTFQVSLVARADGITDVFHWRIVGGTGAYQDLIGRGSGEGIYQTWGVLDLYTGRVH